MLVQVRYYPRIIRFLGYNPLPEPRTLGEAVRRERLSRGLSRATLAGMIGIQFQGSIQRLEEDRPVSPRVVRRTCAALDLSRDAFAQ